MDARDAAATLRREARNVLGLMRAIIRRSAATSASVDEYAAHVEGRFDALLRIQTLLIASSDGSVDLHRLIANELLAHVIHEGEQAALDGPVVRLPSKSAELLGLAFHELTINAVKYGAMSVSSGRIAVSWSLSCGVRRVLSLTWLETGLSSLAPSPKVRGFGVETLENLLKYQLDAESLLEFRPEGLRFVIEIPLPAIDGELPGGLASTLSLDRPWNPSAH
jgi:two-component sensor histidine kinase